VRARLIRAALIAVCMLAFVPGSASAAQPSGDTGSATITGATTATLTGYLNPGLSESGHL
jgi:hypothetical protein